MKNYIRQLFFLIPSIVLLLTTTAFADDSLVISVSKQNLSATVTVTFTTSGNQDCTGTMSVSDGRAGGYTKDQSFILGNSQNKVLALTNLKNNTTYTVRAACTTSLAYANVSATSTFTIGVATPTLAPASNKFPTAMVGPDQTIAVPQNEVTLTGSGTDPDGKIISYRWSKNSGSGTITSATSPTTTITGLTQGVSVFQFVVTDDKNVTDVKTVKVTVQPVLNTAASGAGNTPRSSGSSAGKHQCNDGIDNQIGDGKDYGYGVGKGDGKADHYGYDTIISNGKGDGVIDVEPDPSCFSETATEEKGDDVVSSIIPCTDKCTFTDVFRLLNNFITFFFKSLLVPIVVLMIMYAGFQYLTAEGNPSKKANLKKLIWNLIKGVLLILCSWLIVRTIMTTVLNEDFKQSGVELLGN